MRKAVGHNQPAPESPRLSTDQNLLAQPVSRLSGEAIASGSAAETELDPSEGRTLREAKT
ncbi:hypothetical protein METY_2793 [Methylopila sp. Yamaguchi]|nr:hypothetical protein METY_2793 [Methylopila sp. Yamaguchi]